MIKLSEVYKICPGFQCSAKSSWSTGHFENKGFAKIECEITNCNFAWNLHVNRNPPLCLDDISLY